MRCSGSYGRGTLLIIIEKEQRKLLPSLTVKTHDSEDTRILPQRLKTVGSIQPHNAALLAETYSK